MSDDAWFPNAHENQQAPVLKLPEDVLLSIFIMLRDWDWKPRTAVTRLTHVCREWRYIAIAAPLLWTRLLSSYHPDWTTAALQRARMAPIEVELDFLEGDCVTDLSEALLQHISHTSKLDMYGPCDHLNKAQELIPTVDATQLEELIIWCSSYKREVFELTRSFVLSPTTFCQTHRLRRLYLHYVDIDFNSPLLQNLTTLDLAYLSPEAVPTWSKLLEVLRAMPLLEDLRLQHVFTPSDAPAALISSLEPLWLHSLHSISIECSTTSQLFVFLTFVLFPRLRYFHLQWNANDLGPNSTVIFNSIARAVYAQQLGGIFETLEVHQRVDSGHLCLRAFSIERSVLTVSVPRSPVEIGEAHVITDFIDALCMPNLTSFKLKVDDEYGHGALLRLADKLSLLENLTVGNVTAFNFVDILGMEPLTPQSESLPQTCLPSLETITWIGGDFSGREKWVDEAAVGILARRQEHGVGVKSLEFGEVENLSPGLVALFERGVPKVVVRNPDS